MRPLIVTQFMSLDGVVEAPGGEPGYRNAGWTFQDIAFDPAAYAIKGSEQEEAGALVLGRVSYQAFAPVWGSMPEFDRYNTLPRYVVSTTLAGDDDRWPATIIRSTEDVRELKEGGGGPLLVHGSATLHQSLLAADLVDRYHLLVFPVLLGAGKRLFPDVDRAKVPLTVLSSETYSNGITKLVLDVVHDRGATPPV